MQWRAALEYLPQRWPSWWGSQPRHEPNDADAKKLLKAMSDYLAAQTAISFGYDTNLEVVTKDHQKLLLASSGAIDLSRPDKIRASRHGGFANVENGLRRQDANAAGQGRQRLPAGRCPRHA